MGLTIKKVPNTTKKTSPVRGKKSVKSQKVKGERDTSAQAKKQLDSMSSTMEKYHSKSDDELRSFVEPDESRKNAHNYRLNDEQREARLVLLHRLLIRKIKPEEIRAQLQISTAMYYKLKDQLEARMRLDVSKVDVPYLIGDTLAFYDEVRSMSLTISSQASVKDMRVKLTAMQVALRAEQDKNSFLTSCGVYSAPVVEHIVRGMVSTGNFSVTDRGNSERVLEAEECLMTIASELNAFMREAPVQSIAPALPDLTSEEVQSIAPESPDGAA